MLSSTQVNNAHMATADYDRQGQTAYRQYKMASVMTVVEVASGKGHA